MVESRERSSGLKPPLIKSIILLCVLSLTYGCQCLKTKKAAPLSIGGFSSPESVIAGPGARIYVSNVGEKLEPSAKDADGFISELSSAGEVLNKKYLPREGVLNAPKGMAVIGNILYVTDIDRIAGFDLASRDQIFELDFSSEKTSFLNDLAVFDDHTLFVSATDTGKVYRVSLGEKPSFTVVQENIAGANGLYFDKGTNRLFVVGFGEGYKANGDLGVISLKDNSYQKLAGPIGALDGVALLPDGRVIFSDWVAFDRPGKIRAYSIDKKELSEIKLSEDVRGPADFYYDSKTNTIWLPRMMEGKVLVEEIN